MKSELLKRKTKCQLYPTIILPAVLYGSECWTLGKASEALLGGSERKILRKIYGAIQVDRVWNRSSPQQSAIRVHDRSSTQQFVTEAPRE
jgi:hypothetical protein